MESLQENSAELKAKTDSLRKLKTTTYDQFQEGTKKASYDYVIATIFSADVSADDVEMQEDVYNYYSSAPVFCWVLPAGDEAEALKALFNKMHPKSHCIVFEGDDKEAQAKGVLQALEWAESQYNTLSNDTVKKVFDTYDKDGSGAIDAEELQKLSEELGRPLTADELAEAMKDLDINKDGVVDFDEFRRWWFSGFKSYSGARRSMIKMKKKAKNALDALVQGNLDSPLNGTLSVKHHSAEITYNSPATAGTKVCANLYPGGDQCYMIHHDLKYEYKDTLKTDDFAAMLKEYGENIDEYEFGYLQLRLKMKGDCTELAAKLQTHYEGLGSLFEPAKCFVPKIAPKGEYLEIGIGYPIPKKMLKSIDYNKLTQIVD